MQKKKKKSFQLIFELIYENEKFGHKLNFLKRTRCGKTNYIKNYYFKLNFKVPEVF